MKKLISLALSVLLVFSMTAVAYAAPTADDISYTIKMGTDSAGNATQTISVKGLYEGAAGKFVTLRVWKDGMGVADYDEDPSAREYDIDLFAVLQQTLADKNGNFKFEFLFAEDAGSYKTDIKVQGENIVSINMNTADLDDANDFIDDINNSAKLDSMTEEAFQPILDNPANYGVDLTVFNNLTPANQDKVLQAVIDELIANKKDGNKNNIGTVVETIGKRALVSIFKQTDDAAILSEAFDIYEDIVNIENLEDAAGIYPLFESFEDEQDDIFVEMGKTEYTDIEDLLEGFKSTVFLKAVKDTQYYTELGPIIESNFDYLNIDEDDVDDYENKSGVRTFVLKAVNKTKASLDSKDDFVDTFEDAVAEYNKESSKKGSSGSSGGSGGGGGVSSSVSVSTDLLPSNTAKSAAAVYNDISGHWAQLAITTLSTQRIINGRGDGIFDPDGAVTRAEFSKMVVEAYGLYDEDAEAKFTDVKESDWYYGYVASMAERGFLLGDDNGAFNPNQLIKRQDMAVILHRVLLGTNQLPVLTVIEKLFTDFEQVSPYAQNSVAYMSNMKMINGSNGIFRPHDTSTRAEAAQIIYNAIMGEGNK